MRSFRTDRTARLTGSALALLSAALICSAADAAPQIALPAPVSVVGESEGPAAGLLDPTQDLGAELWSGSKRGVIVSLMDGALAVSDPALQALARRIILSKSDAPNGPTKRALVTTRIAELLHAGMISEAGELAAHSKLSGDADFARVQADALLYAGRTDVVCGSVTDHRLTDASPFWLELRAYCAHVNHNAVLEELTDVVLKAQLHDPAFDMLYADVRQQKSDVPADIAHPTALHIFMLRQLKLPLPASLQAKGGVPENLFLLQDPHADPAIRLAAADYLAPRGALNPAELQALLEAYQPASSEIQNAASLAPTLSFVHAQLLLHIAAARSTDMPRKVALMREAMMLGQKAGLPFLAAGLQADVLKTLKPVHDADMAMLGRALLLAGDDDDAGVWLMGDDPLQVIPLMRQTGPAAGGALQSVMIRLAGLRPPKVSVKKTGDDSDDDDDDSKTPRATPAQWLAVRLTSVLEELPLTVLQNYPKVFSTHLPGAMPDAMLMAEIANAAKAPGRHGEALLRMMQVIREIGWANLSPDATVSFVRTLRDMGYRDPARAFAREAMLLYAPPAPQTAAPVPPAP